MIRITVALLFAVIVATCPFASAQVGPVAQTNSTLRAGQDALPQADSTPIQFQHRYPRYRLRKSDVIDLKFKLSPEFDQTVTVQPDGYVSLDVVGDMQVENKTIPT